VSKKVVSSVITLQESAIALGVLQERQRILEEIEAMDSITLNQISTNLHLVFRAQVLKIVIGDTDVQ
jgi:hypothetical protein